MNEPDNTPGGPLPVGTGYNVLTGLLLVAALVLYFAGRESPWGEQPALYLYSATCLICAMLCRVVVAIKQLKK